jgi:glycosyltransferase involved in cell wall biosynthesis
MSDTRLRILLAIDSLGSGGAQRQMVTLAKNLASRGHSVYLSIYYPDLNYFEKDISETGVTICRIPKGGRWSVRPAFGIRKVFKEFNCDIVLSFLTTPNIYAIFASRILNTNAVVVSERFMFRGGKIKFISWLAYRIYRYADAITVNSKHHLNEIQSRYPGLQETTRCIYNGVDLERFSMSATENRLSAKEVSLLAIASVSQHKNPLGLARALSICHQKGVDAKVTWVGVNRTSAGGSTAFRETEDELKRAGLEKYWTWLGERDDIPFLLQNYDALVHPSYFEGLPNVICEALASGQIVLAGNVCDHAELLQNGRHGYLFDPHVPKDIARTIIEFSSTSNVERAAMRESAREYAESNLSIGSFVDSYEDLLRRIVNQRREK